MLVKLGLVLILIYLIDHSLNQDHIIEKEKEEAEERMR